MKLIAPKRETKQRMITVRITEKKYQTINKLANRNKLSLADTARALIDIALKQK